MFVFPASFRQLWDQLDVPPKIRQGQDLLVAIGFQVYEPARGALGIPIETYSSKWNTDGKDDGLIENRSVICNRALQALSFSDTLFKRIDNKVCAIFPTITDTPLAELDPDTMALTTVLSSAPGCKMASVLAGEARFIFIHVGAWGALHKLVGLVDRRLRRQDVQFYTYGSDPTVEPKYWGVQQVFLTGIGLFYLSLSCNNAFQAVWLHLRLARLQKTHKVLKSLYANWTSTQRGHVMFFHRLWP